MRSLNHQGRTPQASVSGLPRRSSGSQYSFSTVAQCAAVVMFLGLIFAGAVGWRYQRVHANQVWLDECRAEYEWHCEALRVFQPAYHAIQQKVAAIIGPVWVSDFYSVQLAGQLDDQALENIDRLHNVVRMTLQSDTATDQTLADIGRLRELRSLTLVGKQFSFEGLLELRKLPKLRQLVLGNMVLTMAELAVLETAVPQANIKYSQDATSHVYERQMVARIQRGDKKAERPQVGFAPLLGHVPSDQSPDAPRTQM